jgi:drug/metabolite transporter (DMT)-like permease
LLVLLGRVSPLDARTLALVGGAGALGLIVYFPYFRALRTASPVDVLLLWNFAPVCVAVLAVLVIHEHLGLRQAVGGASLVCGAVVAVFQPSVRRRGFQAVGWMLLASVLVGGEAVSEKAVYLRVPFSSGFAWMSLTQLCVALVIGVLHRPTGKEVRSCLKGSVIRLVAGNEAMDLAASTARSLAVSLGSVSIVHAIGALQPVFLLGFAWIAGRRPSADRLATRRRETLRIAFAVTLAVLGMGLIQSGG